MRLESGIELLDMPGVLWPKFDDRQVGERLAYTGAIKDDVYDLEWVAMRFLDLLRQRYPQLLQQRFKVTEQEYEGLEPFDLLELVGKKRGMMLPGGVVNTERAAVTVLDEFRSGKIGRISLERPARRPGEGAADNRTTRRRGCQMIEETSLFRYDEQLRREGCLSLCGRWMSRTRAAGGAGGGCGSYPAGRCLAALPAAGCFKRFQKALGEKAGGSV